MNMKEKISHHARTLSRLRWKKEQPKSERWLDDGFGSYWLMCSKPDCDLQVVRPGKAQCNGMYNGSCDEGNGEGP